MNDINVNYMQSPIPSPRRRRQQQLLKINALQSETVSFDDDCEKEREPLKNEFLPQQHSRKTTQSSSSPRIRNVSSVATTLCLITLIVAVAALVLVGLRVFDSSYSFTFLRHSTQRVECISTGCLYSAKRCASISNYLHHISKQTRLWLSKAQISGNKRDSKGRRKAIQRRASNKIENNG